MAHEEDAVSRETIPKENFEAVVKPEYLIKSDASDQFYTIDDDSAERKEREAEALAEGEKHNKRGGKKKAKGQNKHRDNSRKLDITKSICPAVIDGQECPRLERGERCVFIHDRKAFAESKAVDIGEHCPAFEDHGHCKFGVSCRFSKGHVDPDTFVNIKDTEKMARQPLLTLNKIDKAMQFSLRRREFDFTKSDAVISQLQREGVLPNRPNKHEVKKVKLAEPSEPIETAEVVGITLGPREKKRLDWSGKTYLAPLTTVGNLPFRRVCKFLGADITCGEMAVCSNLLQGQASEVALLRRHPTEDFFGVQVCGGHADICSRAVEFIETNCNVDFIDLNCGCPMDIFATRGMGSGLLDKGRKLEGIVRAMSDVADCPVTLKLRTGMAKASTSWTAAGLINKAYGWGAQAITLHGRSREQRYSRPADWDYIAECCPADTVKMPFFGNGDIMNYRDSVAHMAQAPYSGLMVARGALIKPWIFTEIKEQRDWDISSSERLDLLRTFVNTGLMHWGSDELGVEKTRRFLLEWLSFLYRYIPVGLLDVVPQKMNDRLPMFYGRNDLETLMASPKASDWTKISSLLLGPAPEDHVFVPKHKSNAV